MKNPQQQIPTSVLVFGTGEPDLRAALELAERGTHLLVVGLSREGR